MLKNSKMRLSNMYLSFTCIVLIICFINNNLLENNTGSL